MADFIKIGDHIAFRKSAVIATRVIQSKDDATCSQETRYSLVVEYVAGANRISNYMNIPDNVDADKVFQEVLDKLNG